MSLTDTINNTNTQKENIKTVATNIDNKLIELGGERATNLVDVVNKMGAMVGQYKKIAEGVYNSDLISKNVYNSGIGSLDVQKWRDIKIPLNVNFTPKRIIIYFEYMNSGEKIEPDLNYAPYKLTIDSLYNKNESTAGGMGKRNSEKVFIKNISKTEVTLAMSYLETRYSSTANNMFFMKAPIKWTAIG